MNNLTMQQLEDLGFTVVKNYEHDHYIAQIRKKGNITIETTWDEKDEYKFVKQVLTIEETHKETFNRNELFILDNLINKGSRIEDEDFKCGEQIVNMEAKCEYQCDECKRDFNN